MEQEVLNLIKEEINKEKTNREYYLGLLNQKDEFEQDDKIKKYLKLKEKLESSNYIGLIQKNDDEIMNEIFYKYEYMMKKTNQIYVYLGTFMSSINFIQASIFYDVMVKRDDNRGEYRKYRDLENGYIKVVNINDSEEFEKNNIVLFPDTILLSSYYDEIREKFIKLILTEGEESALKKILKQKEKPNIRT